MGTRQQDTGPKPKEKARSPSTGRGAASALDALIKRRVPPESAPAPAPQAPNKA
jgi:hypothetical protein